MLQIMLGAIVNTLFRLFYCISDFFFFLLRRFRVGAVTGRFGILSLFKQGWELQCCIIKNKYANTANV